MGGEWEESGRGVVGEWEGRNIEASSAPQILHTRGSRVAVGSEEGR